MKIEELQNLFLQKLESKYFILIFINTLSITAQFKIKIIYILAVGEYLPYLAAGYRVQGII